MLKATDVEIFIEKKPVVQRLSFSCNPGEWWMLLGPNGAGKSTLLGALAGTMPFHGNVTLGENSIVSMPVRSRAQKIGVLSQNGAVGAAFTVEQIVAMGRYSHRKGLFGADEPDLAQRVTRALELTGMTQLRGQSMLTLSGGERQRAFLAQVFCQDPQVLLLDEPTNHLDLVYQKQIFSLIDEWRKQSGRLVISVVHDLSLARCFGTHALILDEGKCVAQGKIDEVLTDENLNRVWRMNVRAWRETLHAAWK